MTRALRGAAKSHIRSLISTGRFEKLGKLSKWPMTGGMILYLEDEDSAVQSSSTVSFWFIPKIHRLVGNVDAAAGTRKADLDFNFKITSSLSQLLNLKALVWSVTLHQRPACAAALANNV